jgi:hypothetical protein
MAFFNPNLHNLMDLTIAQGFRANKLNIVSKLMILPVLTFYFTLGRPGSKYMLLVLEC